MPNNMALANALDARAVAQMMAMRGQPLPGQQSLGGPRGQMQGYGPPPMPPPGPVQGPFMMPGMAGR